MKSLRILAYVCSLVALGCGPLPPTEEDSRAAQQTASSLVELEKQGRFDHFRYLSFWHGRLALDRGIPYGFEYTGIEHEDIQSCAHNPSHGMDGNGLGRLGVGVSSDTGVHDDLSRFSNLVFLTAYRDGAIDFSELAQRIETAANLGYRVILDVGHLSGDQIGSFNRQDFALDLNAAQTYWDTTFSALAEALSGQRHRLFGLLLKDEPYQPIRPERLVGYQPATKYRLPCDWQNALVAKVKKHFPLVPTITNYTPWALRFSEDAMCQTGTGRAIPSDLDVFMFDPYFDWMAAYFGLANFREVTRPLFLTYMQELEQAIALKGAGAKPYMFFASNRNLLPEKRSSLQAYVDNLYCVSQPQDCQTYQSLVEPISNGLYEEALAVPTREQYIWYLEWLALHPRNVGIANYLIGDAYDITSCAPTNVRWKDHFGTHSNDSTMRRDIAIGEWVKGRDPKVTLSAVPKKHEVVVAYEMNNPGEQAVFDLEVSFFSPAGEQQSVHGQLELTAGEKLTGKLVVPRSALPVGHSQLLVGLNMARPTLSLSADDPLPRLMLAADAVTVSNELQAAGSLASFQASFDQSLAEAKTQAGVQLSQVKSPFAAVLAGAAKSSAPPPVLEQLLAQLSAP